MNFGGYFSAEDAGRLPPFKDDKLKDTQNSQIEASSVLVIQATGRIETSLVPPWKVNREEIIIPLTFSEAECRPCTEDMAGGE